MKPLNSRKALNNFAKSVNKQQSKNWKFVMVFSEYCLQHPELRPFQALKNWLNIPFILFDICFAATLETRLENLRDTYNLEEDELLKMTKK